MTVRAGVRRMAVVACIVATACAPRARPLEGAPVPTALRLPQVELTPAPQRVVFRWRYEEDGFSARGEGVARAAAPDSARLDFFLDGGFGGGWAILVRDAIASPAGDVARRLIPPAPMLWAALGRLAITPGRDTTLRQSGDTLRADVASADRTWRVTLAGPRLVGLEQLVGGRVVERLSRDSARVRYTNVVARRALSIDVQRVDSVGPFPPAIWSPPL